MTRASPGGRTQASTGTDPSQPSIGIEYSPLNPAMIADPYPIFARARQHEPIFFSPVLNMWVATRYEDISQILKDTRRFSSSGAVGVELVPEAQEVLKAGFPVLAHSIVNLDPPRHDRLRSNVNKAFTPQRVASLEPRIRGFANRLIDRFIADGCADIVTQFAHQLPMLVICDFIGVPEEDMERVKRWTEGWVQLVAMIQTPEEQVACAREQVAYQQYVVALLDRHRAHPQNNFTSDLLATIESGETDLQLPELVELINNLIIGGHETTINLIGNCVYHLLAQRERWQGIVDAPQLIRNVVEETLRFDGSVIGVFRRVTEDVTLGGVTIPANSRLWVAVSSANRDEVLFDAPDMFNPQRPHLPRHLGFGHGIHFCLGAPLARLELTTALDVLRSRMPSLRLVADQSLTYRPTLTRCLSQLLVEWDCDEV